jgi:hypothetical protein
MKISPNNLAFDFSSYIVSVQLMKYNIKPFLKFNLTLLSGFQTEYDVNVHDLKSKWEYFFDSKIPNFLLARKSKRSYEGKKLAYNVMCYVLP